MDFGRQDRLAWQVYTWHNIGNSALNTLKMLVQVSGNM